MHATHERGMMKGARGEAISDDVHRFNKSTLQSEDSARGSCSFVAAIDTPV